MKRPSSTKLIRRVAQLGVIAAIAAASAITTPPASATSSSAVLPPSAAPNGYTRLEMTRLLAQFSSSGNKIGYYPDTPIQVLYADPASEQATQEHGGLAVTGSNEFTVGDATSFYVPVNNVDDSPPVIGTFPTTRAQASSYYFGESEVGGRGSVTVDGTKVPLGSAYVAGPVTTKPLQDGGGTHMMTLGAFIAPLSPGVHVVSIDGGFFGKEIKPASGFDFISGQFTYRIKVFNHA
jgi:hypothetical protein